ncbi:hypothetical protein [Snuella sedimenti]|uniref:F5/8 type C domain-containing protein n=1 Tax=Snuella sedimenti TaxID=2798802 RepID=A0A8J7IHA0_9FLAO|nr:hypothetical protein [Snuella sedimenti]MBJ6367786.1 hypothetical protein [Snuella sedimenti]
MKNTRSLVLVLTLLVCVQTFHSQEKIYPGADEKTPSRAQYFSWINNTNEGPTEAQTQINLDFFNWLKQEYGMQLDIYAFDAGAIDGKRFYGSVKSDRFKNQFPYGLDSIYKKATDIGIRLGVWGGPDGFGDSSEEEKERTDQMVDLCRDYNFALFKFDAVCGPLRPEKEDAFIHMMQESRKYSPDLILLNHRLGLNKGKPYATTFLFGGAETYVDVFMTNDVTAPHHRAGAISRGLVPGLQRLTEDHGVCLSSCLDYWDDDLVLQAFNRSLILAPEIYGNPWFLRDDEFPKLARIYNVHRKYKDILVNGMVLPEAQYGPNAVARGDEKTRIITLRNLTWSPVEYQLTLNKEIGLTNTSDVKLIQLHPNEKYLGTYNYNDNIPVEVAPFRSAMYLVTSEDYDDPLIKGAAFNVLRNVNGKSVLIDVVGEPGSEATINLDKYNDYKSALINGKEDKKLVQGKNIKLRFGGEQLKLDPNRKLAGFNEISIPEDAEALYEATLFAADNNALEVRSLYRSGNTSIPEVRKARDAFFEQSAFVDRGIWDKNLFDGDMATGFWPSKKYDIDLRIKKGALRLDLGEVVDVDEIIVYVPDYFSLHPLLREEGNYVEVSTDLKRWETITYLADLKSTINIHKKIRYLRFRSQSQHIVEIEGFKKGKPLDRKKWRASNLFAHPIAMPAVKSWKSEFTLNEIPKGSYLSVALNGKHGEEGAYAAAKIGGKLVGAPDRAVSYPSNTWEYVNAKKDSNYTYYIPLDASYKGQNIEVFVMSYDKDNTDFTPEVWLSSDDDANEKIRVELFPN